MRRSLFHTPLKSPFQASWLLRTSAAMLCSLSGGAYAAGATTLDLPGDRAFPEAITATADGTLYVSNLAGGGILRIRPNQAPEVWLKPGDHGTRSTLGVLADEKRGLLWVCSNDMSMIGIPSPGTQKGSSLKSFDLKSGQPKSSASLPGDAQICNDIAIDKAGDVYVTDTLAPNVLKLSKDQKSLAVWKADPALAPAEGGGLDGIAFGSDGNMIVNKIGSGELFRIEVKNGVAGALTALKPSRPLVMPDGLRLADDGKSFWLIEGEGLSRMTIEGDVAKVELIKGGLVVPTNVVQLGKKLWISEGQNGYLLDPKLKGQSPRLPFRLYLVTLP